MHRFHKHLRNGWGHFWVQLIKALRNPAFIALTVIGNVALFACATALYWIESDVNPTLTGFPDALWWAFSTMTTVGYGDIVPVTGIGRLVAVVLVFTGGVLFFSFMALIGSSFTELEFLELRSDIRELRRELSEIKHLPENFQRTDKGE